MLEALDIIVWFLGIVDIPRDRWSDNDSQELRRARKFVQEHRKVNREGEGQERSRALAGNITEQSDPPEVEGGVRTQGLPVQARAEGPGRPSTH